MLIVYNFVVGGIKMCIIYSTIFVADKIRIRLFREKSSLKGYVEIPVKLPIPLEDEDSESNNRRN